MATQIQLLHSLTAGNKPGDLAPGELAYNLADGFSYLGNGTNNYTDTLGNIIGPSMNPGGGWQQAVFNASPVHGSVTLAGIYDAQDNLVTSVTAAGTAVGFTAGDPLPAAASGNTDYYVLVEIGGTLAPPAPAGTANPGDWLVSTGNGWSMVQNSNNVIPAANVDIIPTGPFTGPTMQDVLNQIQLSFVSSDAGAVSSLNVNGPLSVGGNSALGNDSADTTTVSGPFTAQSTAAITGNTTVGGSLVVSGASTLTGAVTASNNVQVGGNLTVLGNTTLGNASADIVTVAGSSTFSAPVTVSSTLTVTGQTTLGPGNTSITGATTISGSPVEVTGAVLNIRSANVAFTGNVTIGDVSTDTLTVNSTTTHSAATTFNAAATFNGTVNLPSTTNYDRPGAQASAALNQMLVIPGTIIAYGGVSVPNGYLACDGSAVSRSTYADLFFAISTTWGGGDGSTTFNVPDLRGLFLRGTGTNNTVNTSAGTKAIGPAVGGTTGDTFRQHSHSLLNADGTNVNTNWRNLTDSINQGGNSGLTSSGNVNYGQTVVGNAGSAETKPCNAGVTYLIKF